MRASPNLLLLSSILEPKTGSNNRMAKATYLELHYLHWAYPHTVATDTEPKLVRLVEHFGRKAKQKSRSNCRSDPQEEVLHVR